MRGGAPEKYAEPSPYNFRQHDPGYAGRRGHFEFCFRSDKGARAPRPPCYFASLSCRAVLNMQHESAME